MECRKGNCGANSYKNWAKLTKYASCIVFSKPQRILPAKDTRPNKKINGNVFMKKVTQRSVRLIWSVEKVKCEANRTKV